MEWRKEGCGRGKREWGKESEIERERERKMDVHVHRDRETEVGRESTRQ